MPYVSARYLYVVELSGTVTTDKYIQATDSDGVVWSLPPDCQVGDWLRYLDEGGTIDPAEIPDDAKEPREEPEE